MRIAVPASGAITYELSVDKPGSALADYRVLFQSRGYAPKAGDGFTFDARVRGNYAVGNVSASFDLTEIPFSTLPSISNDKLHFWEWFVGRVVETSDSAPIGGPASIVESRETQDLRWRGWVAIEKTTPTETPKKPAPSGTPPTEKPKKP